MPRNVLATVTSACPLAQLCQMPNIAQNVFVMLNAIKADYTLTLKFFLCLVQSGTKYDNFTNFDCAKCHRNFLYVP